MKKKIKCYSSQKLRSRIPNISLIIVLYSTFILKIIKKHDSSINPFDKNLNIKWPIKIKLHRIEIKKRSILKMHCRNCKTRIRKSFLKFKDFPLVNNLKTKPSDHEERFDLKIYFCEVFSSSGNEVVILKAFLPISIPINHPLLQNFFPIAKSILIK